jgi:hypothetical protein
MPQTNLYSIAIPPMIKSLTALSGILDKLSTHAAGKQLEWHPAGMQEDALMQSRLISDQFPFVRQVQIACDNAKGCAARLAEIENPKHEDTEKTVAELKARIEKTISFIQSVKPEQIAGKEDIRVGSPYWGEKTLSGFEYVNYYLLPNFYFHLATAYSILRANGVDLGKADFIGDVPLK